jgi:hypothetical protein
MEGSGRDLIFRSRFDQNLQLVTEGFGRKIQHKKCPSMATGLSDNPSIITHFPAVPHLRSCT